MKTNAFASEGRGANTVAESTYARSSISRKRIIENEIHAAGLRLTSTSRQRLAWAAMCVRLTEVDRQHHQEVP